MYLGIKYVLEVGEFLAAGVRDGVQGSGPRTVLVS